MDVNEEDRKSFKKLRSMRSFVGRVRSSQDGYIKYASTMEKLENANLEKAKTALGENPLLKDSGLVAGKRQVVFATEKDVELLTSCSTLYLDGAFKPASKLFNQVWTVAGEYKHHFVPCVFSLLTNKDTESYIFVLNELKIRGVNPSKVHGDFEAGEIAAINERTWVGGEIDGKMKRPKYSFATWHYYKIAEEMEARTNNALEAFNRSLQEKQQTSNLQTVVDADRSHYRADTRDLQVRDVCRKVDWFADDKLTYLDSLVSILRPDRFV
uniref:MULE transposase domain-containing protein n=1 Tax=Acrobeloides nanus TaxID=290746 RepID=A0A914DPI9_9BILA